MRRVEIDPSVSRMGMTREGQLEVNSLERYLHGPDSDITERMAKRSNQSESMPGNDGTWFLELVGAKQSAPHHSETLAELASIDEELAETPAVEPGATTAGIIGAAPATLTHSVTALDTSGASTETTSGALLAEEFTATTDDTVETPVVTTAASAQDDLSDWKPDDISRPLRSRRSFRWTAVILLIAVVVAAATAIVLIPRSVDQQASKTAGTYREALVGLRNELPEAQLVLADLTDPTTTDETLGTVIPRTQVLKARAHAVTELGAAPLPSTPPLFPRGAIETLEPTREALAILGAEGDLIAARVGRGYLYRTTVPELFATPPLPTSATDSAIDQLSVALAASLAETAGLVADLPEDPAFVGARDAAVEGATEFADWQLLYLEALRAGDTETAVMLVADLDELRTGVIVTTEQGLLVLRQDVDRQIVDLAGEIEAVLIRIPD
jgi:hypothetical protein